MLHYQLREILDETKLSPEELAPKFGVSNMTLRRWKRAPGNKEIPKSHERNIVEGIYQLLIEKRINSESQLVQDALSNTSTLSFQAVLKSIGVSDDFNEVGGNQQDKMTVALYQIGSSEKRKKEVDENQPQLNLLKKMGSEWTRRISLLVEASRSKKLSKLDKLVAYGALFYLICPFDLIPDHIPVIGYLDDFGMLGFAVSYYVKKFPELFSNAG